MTSIEEAKSRYTIFDIISRLGFPVASSNGTRAIRCISGLHEDKHPSLVIMPEVNRVECKSCGFKGDGLDLIIKTQNLADWKEACLWLEPSLNFTHAPEEKQVTIDPEKYLATRGITQETANKFGLRIGKAFGKDCLIIPLPTGEKYRFINPGKGELRFAQKTGTKACLFTAGNFKDAKKVIGFEGELDAILAWQNTGYPCFSSTAGAETFPEEWKEHFSNKEAVCFAYDNDKAGVEGAKKAAEILGIERCKYVTIPEVVGKDATDFFKFGKTKQDFDDLLKTATSYKTTFADQFQKASENGITKIPTGIKQVDAIIDGLRAGNTYQLAGLKKSGKTSLLSMMTNNLLNNNVKVGYIDTELGAQELGNRLAAIYNDVSIKEAETNQAITKEWVDLFSDNFFYSSIEDNELLDSGNLSTDKLLAKMQDNVNRGCKVQIFDNLTTLTTLQIKNKSGWEVVSAFISQLIQFAKRNKIVVLYVIHTKEAVIYTETPEGIKTLIENGKAEDIFKESITINRKPTTSDILGGTAAHSQLGGTFLLWRPYQDLERSLLQQLTQLDLADFRHAPTGQTILLSFKGDKGTFVEIEQPINQPEVSNNDTVISQSDNVITSSELNPPLHVNNLNEENEFTFKELV